MVGNEATVDDFGFIVPFKGAKWCECLHALVTPWSHRVIAIARSISLPRWQSLDRNIWRRHLLCASLPSFGWDAVSWQIGEVGAVDLVIFKSSPVPFPPFRAFSTLSSLLASAKFFPLSALGHIDSESTWKLHG